MPSLQDLSNCLGGTLSSNPNERMTAELKLSEYLQHTGASFPAQHTASKCSIIYDIDTGLALSQIVVEQQADIALRQMSVLPTRHERRVLMTFLWFGL